MRKIVSVALLVAVLASSLCLLENAKASTPVIGIITVDTTWTKAGSPYQLTGPTAVGNGVTLTIEPGASVDLGNYYLEINGTLRAKGTSSENIVISATTKMGTYYNQKMLFSDPSTDWNEQSGTGSIIENTILNCVSITMNDASPKISNNHFKDTSFNNLLTVNRGSPIITGNDMVFNGNGFKCSTGNGSPIFSDNVLTGKGGRGNWGVFAEGIIIKDNVFSGIETAINNPYDKGILTVIGNTITNCSTGINYQYGSGTISGNSITYCDIAILAADIVTNNLIENNGYGIQEAHDNASIHYNNIMGNTKGNVYISGNRDVDATNNYWGTTNEPEISQSIHDKKNDYNLGTVNFKPYLTSPAETGYVEPSPLPNNAPTPTTSGSYTPQPSAPTETPDENGFLIQSNSTISAFSYDSSIPQISFIVNGPEETSGYVKLTIAKSFTPNAEAIQVYLDGEKINREITSNGDSWIVIFTYHHSTHQVIVNSAQESAIPSWIWNAAIVLTAIGLAAAAVILVWSAKHKPRIDSINQF